MKRPNEEPWGLRVEKEQHKPVTLSPVNPDDYSVKAIAKAKQDICYGFGTILSLCGVTSASPSMEWVELRVAELAKRRASNEH